jgi:hypothetical protein
MAQEYQKTTHRAAVGRNRRCPVDGCDEFIGDPLTESELDSRKFYELPEIKRRDLCNHFRQKHCAMCGTKGGVKYTRADHLGYWDPPFRERCRRLVEDIRAKLVRGSTIDWDQHEGGIRHTLIDTYCGEPPEYINSWQTILICNECAPVYRRIVEYAKVATESAQPYPDDFQALQDMADIDPGDFGVLDHV